MDGIDGCFVISKNNEGFGGIIDNNSIWEKYIGYVLFNSWVVFDCSVCFVNRYWFISEYGLVDLEGGRWKRKNLIISWNLVINVDGDNVVRDEGRGRDLRKVVVMEN